MTNPLANLELDYWYKGVIVVAAAALLACIATSNVAGIAISSGFLFIGFGEWVNHPKRQTIYPRGILTDKTRDPSIFGIALDFTGFSLIIGGIIFIVFG